ncbi:MAG: response regulator [Ignavibacteriaceae bacterium]
MVNDYSVLLGEDDLITARCIKSNIERKGFRVIHIVESGEELVKSALYECPSLIITDISLKGQLDGIEAIARVSEIREIPYIFITGYIDNITLIRSYNLRPYYTFLKPFDFNVLNKTVEEMFETAENVTSYYLG